MCYFHLCSRSMWICLRACSGCDMTAHAVFAVGHVSRANDTVGIAFRNVKVLGCADDLATDMGRDSTARSDGHGVKRTEGCKRIAEVWWFGAMLQAKGSCKKMQLNVDDMLMLRWGWGGVGGAITFMCLAFKLMLCWGYVHDRLWLCDVLLALAHRRHATLGWGGVAYNVQVCFHTHVMLRYCTFFLHLNTHVMLRYCTFFLHLHTDVMLRWGG